MDKLFRKRLPKTLGKLNLIIIVLIIIFSSMIIYNIGLVIKRKRNEKALYLVIWSQMENDPFIVKLIILFHDYILNSPSHIYFLIELPTSYLVVWLRGISKSILYIPFYVYCRNRVFLSITLFL